MTVDHNDWRVTISLADSAHVSRARQSLAENVMEADVHQALGRTVVVGADHGQVFLYAGTEFAARKAQQIAAEVLAARGIAATTALQRWHPIEEAWEDPDVALPSTPAEQQAEHQRLLDAESAESASYGAGQWEARAEFPTHREAVALADRLRAEGRTVTRRWKFLVVGAANEDDARELADQIRREAPPDATVRAEHAGVWLPFIPF